jgi:hypothetical protein
MAPRHGSGPDRVGKLRDPKILPQSRLLPDRFLIMNVSPLAPYRTVRPRRSSRMCSDPREHGRSGVPTTFRHCPSPRRIFKSAPCCPRCSTWRASAIGEVKAVLRKPSGERMHSTLGPPTIASVAEVLTANDELSLEGFDDETGRMMLGDLLLSWCLENKKHNEGQDQQVQRVLPTHYFASWLDLPDTVASLRGIPELLTTILAEDDASNRTKGCESISISNRHFVLFTTVRFWRPSVRHCETRGPHQN